MQSAVCANRTKNPEKTVLPFPLTHLLVKPSHVSNGIHQRVWCCVRQICAWLSVVRFCMAAPSQLGQRLCVIIAICVWVHHETHASK